MAEIKEVRIDGVMYDIKDEFARDSIGDLNNLLTDDKSSLVSAINEAAQSGGSGIIVDPDEPVNATEGTLWLDTDEESSAGTGSGGSAVVVSVAVTGIGNAITDITEADGVITATKGTTFLTRATESDIEILEANEDISIENLAFGAPIKYISNLSADGHSIRPTATTYSLPIPASLTFTGATEAVYDGSTDITIDIPKSQAITVNGVSPDENGNIIIAAGGGSGSSIQPDLAQNDPAQPDYVKNRTHWEENRQVLIEWDGVTDDRDVFSTSDYDYYKVSDTILSAEEILGATIASTLYEGQTYDSTIEERHLYDMDGATIVDGALLSVRQTEVTDLDGNSISFQSTGTYFAKVGTFGYISKYFKDTSTVHKIDKKFIPEKPQADMSQTDDTAEDYIKNKTHWAEDGEVVVLKEVAVEFGEYDGTAATLGNRRVELNAEKLKVLVSSEDITTNSLVVIWNGVSYYETASSVSMNDEQMSWYLGNRYLEYDPTNTDTNSPFCIQRVKTASKDTIIIWAQGTEAATVTLSIASTGVVYNQLNDRFIPDNVARKYDILTSWNDLVDVPFDKETTIHTIAFDGITTDRDKIMVSVADGNGFTMSNVYKGSNKVLPDNLVFKWMTRTAIDGSYSLNDYAIIYHGDGCTYYRSGVIDVLVVRNTAFELEGSTYTAPSTGVYFSVCTSNGYCSSFTYEVTKRTIMADCLPKIPAIPDVTEAPTAEQFNALLAALRNAGLMATE